MKRKNALEKLTKKPSNNQAKSGKESQKNAEKEKKDEKEKKTAENEKKKLEKGKKKAQKETEKVEKEKEKAEKEKKKAEKEKEKAEKEKKKAQKEKEKAEKDRERAVLKERDNRVLMKMNSAFKRVISSQDVSSSDSENEDRNLENNDLTVTDNFTDEDLVSRCTDILQVPPRSTVGEKRPRNLSGPQKTPLQMFGCHTQDEGEPMMQPTSTNHSHPRRSFGGKRPRTSYLHSNQSGLHVPRPEQVQQPMITDHLDNNPCTVRYSQPTVGGKRPRIDQQEMPATCQKYDEYLATIRQQQAEITQLKAQGIFA